MSYTPTGNVDVLDRPETTDDAVEVAVTVVFKVVLFTVFAPIWIPVWCYRKWRSAR